jgi:hypothetical protein
MKKYLFAVSVFLILNNAYASLYPRNLEGSYNCNCIEVGTKIFFKSIMIIKKTGETYSMNSKFNDGSFYVGTY